MVTDTTCVCFYARVYERVCACVCVHVCVCSVVLRSDFGFNNLLVMSQCCLYLTVGTDPLYGGRVLIMLG